MISSVGSFKLDAAVVTLEYLEVKPGKRHYLVAYGIDGSSRAPPMMKEAVRAIKIESSGSSSVTVTFSVIISLLLLQCYLHV